MAAYLAVPWVGPRVDAKAEKSVLHSVELRAEHWAERMVGQ